MGSTRTSGICSTAILCFCFGTVSKGWPIGGNVVWTGKPSGLVLAADLGLTGLDLAFRLPNWMVILVMWLLFLSEDSPTDGTGEGSGPAGPGVSGAVREGPGSWAFRPASVAGFGSVWTRSALGISTYWSPEAEQGLEGSRKSKLSGLKDKQMGSEVKGQRSTERLHKSNDARAWLIR